jgi:transcriptional regulator of arginine metabolism
MSAQREKRRRRLVEIVASRDLATQEELAGALAREGWPTTQSSISRDIAALGLVKMNGVYRRAPRAAPQGGNPDEARVSEALLSVEASGAALVVLRTGPGEANHVAVALDRLAIAEIVGTIAGDDTIFVAVRDAKAQRRLIDRLRRVAAGVRAAARSRALARSAT